MSHIEQSTPAAITLTQNPIKRLLSSRGQTSSEQIQTFNTSVVMPFKNVL